MPTATATPSRCFAAEMEERARELTAERARTITGRPGKATWPWLSSAESAAGSRFDRSSGPIANRSSTGVPPSRARSKEPPMST